MVSHDCVAFYLLSQEVAKHVKVVQSGQGADEVFAGYHWYPPLAEPSAARSTARSRPTRRRSSTADDAGVQALLDAGYCADDDPSGRFVTEHFARAGRRDRRRRGAAPGHQVMLVDDPVKRVDNMTMAWGLEAGCRSSTTSSSSSPRRARRSSSSPTAARACSRRPRAGCIPAEVIDRPKGYFPVPALTHLEGPYLDLVRDALYAPAAKERGLFRPRPSTRCSPTPTAG